MATIGATLQSVAQALEEAGIENARFEARLLLEHVLSVETQILIGYPEREIEQDQSEAIQAMLARRLAREPMSHILGYREFWSLRFKVTKDTLTPRPDSESLIEAVLKQFPDPSTPLKVLDLGVGTGCLLLSVLSEYPKARGLGIDLSPKALAVAKENALTLGLSDRCQFAVGNWMEGIEETFDLILSNPPYIPLLDRESLAPEVAEHEPETALFAGEDGLDDYRLLAKQLPSRLKPDGIAVIELGIHQDEAVKKLMETARLSVLESAFDLGGIVRCHIIRKKT